MIRIGLAPQNINAGPKNEKPSQDTPAGLLAGGDCTLRVVNRVQIFLSARLGETA
jgi:hypothetical protein